MSTKKNSQKKVVKPAKAVVEEKDKKALEAPAATNKETKEEPTPAPAPAPEVKENPVNNEVEVPEVVEETKEEKNVPTISGSLGSNLATLGDPKDRLDKNHQVDLMNMIYHRYVSNPTTDNNIGKLAAAQFDAMAIISMVQYNAQVAEDFQKLGIATTMKMAPAIEQAAMELLGVKMTRLPSPNDPKQLILQFEEIPQDIRKNAIKDVKAAETPVPEPNPELPDKEKIEALRNIFGQKINGGIGGNLLKGIEWGRKAFSFPEDEKKSVVLANLISKGVDSTMLNGLRNMISGKIHAEHSILGAHALLKSWCRSTPDEEVAEIAQVLTSSMIERKIQDWNERAGKGSTLAANIDNEFTLINRDILAANAGKIIDAILAGKDDAVADYPDKVGALTVHPSNIRKTFVAAYGDSESILKDKLNEVVKYYATPILRLSAYADKSAYSKK